MHILSRKRWLLPATVAVLVGTLPTCGGGTQTTSTASATATERPIEVPDGWSDQVASMPDNGKEARNAGLSMQVVGTCDSNNGAGMLLKGHGFPPDGSYQVRVLDPSGKEYTYVRPQGRFDKNGSPSGWEWNCGVTASGERDPKGWYSLRLTDTTQGSPTENVSLDEVRGQVRAS